MTRRKRMRGNRTLLCQQVTGIGSRMGASVISRSTSRLDRSGRDETPRVSRPASLLVILALSLGLWAIIWAAAASVASSIAAG